MQNDIQIADGLAGTRMKPAKTNGAARLQDGEARGLGATHEKESIEKLAYEYWLDRGSPDGDADEDWYRAERDIRDQLHTHLDG